MRKFFNLSIGEWINYILDPNYKGHLKAVASHLITFLSVFNSSGVVKML